MGEQKVEAAGRDGQGNPSARRAAQLRRLLARVSDEDMDAIFDKLIELAKDGDLQAIKLVLQYTLGKPGPAAELDCSFLADAAPASQVADAPRPQSDKRDLVRQIEQALQPHGKRTSIAGKPKEFGEEVHVPAGPLALDLE
jgi:alkanesulfonate monooxygenase SsuD/methylene tetrahydromethanopterin reductase-like flavin-dependent oxidoreductase (luciferase family)